MKRVLIVGCGYLGQEVARRWEEQGASLFALTRSSMRAETWRSRGWTPIVGDVGTDGSLPALPEVDVALFAVGFDRQGPHSQQSVYVEGLQRVIDRLAGRCGRLIAVSSSSVYGQSLGEWVDEESSCEPTQAGGRCCLDAEQVALRSSLNPIVLRLTGIYGPGRLLSRVDQLRAGTTLAGSPDSWLNLIHRDDAAEVVLKAAEVEWSGRTCLVTDDEPVRRGAYYQELARLVGAPEPRFDPEQPRERGSGGLNKRCSNRFMKGKLGVTLRHPTYREGLAASLEYP